MPDMTIKERLEDLRTTVRLLHPEWHGGTISHTLKHINAIEAYIVQQKKVIEKMADFIRKDINGSMWKSETQIVIEHFTKQVGAANVLDRC